MTDLPLANRRVVIREDLNVPIRDGRVAGSGRLEAALPSLRAALDAGAAVIVLSHLGRPVEGEYDEKFSLRPVAQRLSELLGSKVGFASQWLDGVACAPGEIVLCENVRFQRGEKSNDANLARRIAALGDIFVMDAFGTAHRAQASTAGAAEYAEVACAGPLLVAELDALSRALSAPRRPLVAIVGGSKVSTKLEVLKSLASRVDVLITGGGIANTLLAASGVAVGRSLVDDDGMDFSRQLLDGTFGGAEIPLPDDVVVGPGLDESATGRVVGIDAVGDQDMILDIGPATVAHYGERLKSAGTIVWNGPVGVFEHPQFAAGTRGIAMAVAASGAFSIAGGGDTLAALEQFGISQDISYVSTGGGAFLEFLEGRTLPAVAVLEQRAADAAASRDQQAD